MSDPDRWFCPNCGANNMPQVAECFACQTLRPTISAHRTLFSAGPLRASRLPLFIVPAVILLALAFTNPGKADFLEWAKGLLMQPARADQSKVDWLVSQTMTVPTLDAITTRQNYFVCSVFKVYLPEGEPAYVLGVAQSFLRLGTLAPPPTPPPPAVAEDSYPPNPPPSPRFLPGGTRRAAAGTEPPIRRHAPRAKENAKPPTPPEATPATNESDLPPRVFLHDENGVRPGVTVDPFAGGFPRHSQ